mmetsp:Transcript_30857/g.95284  ORF Transcript_30857/g.95284 Transcript_30857/m.95284 type:complete len:220 (-) Transcript_30857:521-1180(-)
MLEVPHVHRPRDGAPVHRDGDKRVQRRVEATAVGDDEVGQVHAGVDLGQVHGALEAADELERAARHVRHRRRRRVRDAARPRREPKVHLAVGVAALAAVRHDDLPHAVLGRRGQQRVDLQQRARRRDGERDGVGRARSCGRGRAGLLAGVPVWRRCAAWPGVRRRPAVGTGGGRSFGQANLRHCGGCAARHWLLGCGLRPRPPGQRGVRWFTHVGRHER